MKPDTARIRAILKQAANEVETESVKLWLVNDETGCWETQARDLITMAETKRPGIKPAEVDAQLAIYLAMLAVETKAEEARRSTTRRGAR